MLMWILNLIIVCLMGINVLAWGYCIKDVGLPVFTVEFLLKLTFNKFFIIAMLSALIAALLKYSVVQRLGVFRGNFFLLTSSIVTVLIAYFVLNEKFTFLHCLGVGLVLLGVYILGTY
jgi:drug/metabolite transporter (DMT)-like permease